MRKWSLKKRGRMADSFYEDKRKRMEELNHLPPTFSEWEVSCREQMETVAEMIGCKCVNDIVEEMKEAMKFVEKYTEGEINKVRGLKDKEYLAKLGNLARKYARQHRCHYHRRGLTCYCDEHNH